MDASLQREQLSHQVARVIARQIAALAPGTPLPPQGEFARRLSVSRPVVREAYKLLEARGLIAMQQGRTAVVRDLDHSLLALFFDLALARDDDAITQLLELRRIVEVAIAAMAAEHVAEAELATLRETLDSMWERRDDPEGFIDADILFHVRLAACSGNDMLANIIAALRAPLRTSQIITREGAGRRGDFNLAALDAHREIYAAIEVHDPEAASDAMRRHLETTAHDLRALHPEETDHVEGNVL